MPRARRHGREKVKKDTLDLRDIYYEPSLRELPRALDNWEKVPRVLDQQAEGACVGFATAAVVNYLLANRSDRRGRKPDPVSPRMLYEMAKRYDEWEGEDYEGSSLRGSMKGWFHHGVCVEEEWPYDMDDVGRLTPGAALDAQRHPLGAYYRVRHRHLNHMHAALNETGILLASAAVHSGWDEPDEHGWISQERQTAGGHAFAIVGYDADGFWIQNSWGDGWGFEGFGHLSYADWLENGWDCWVARMGVAVAAFAEGGASSIARARFDYVPYAEVDPSAIADHLVHLGDDGRLKSTGRFATDDEDVHRIVHETVPARTAAWRKPRLMLYAHGGLNTGKASAARIASLRETFLANEIYPVHFMWETGLVASLVGAVRHALSLGRAQGIGEFVTERIDEAIEVGARPLGKPVWNEMKQNAERASAADGGADLLVRELLARSTTAELPEIHLIGHSAGCIFHAHLVERLAAAGIPIASFTLFAPACTTALFREKVVAHRDQIGRIALFNLLDETERDDNVLVYRKSLLYLVSEAFEARRHETLLGLDKHLREDNAIKRFFGAGHDTGSTTRGYLHGMAAHAKFLSKSSDHGGFNDDEATLNATLQTILGRTPHRRF